MTITAVDLRAEAAAEIARLKRARALCREGDESALLHLDGTSPWIAIPRRRRLRRDLGRRVCLIWLIAVEDASGRIVESRAVAVLLEIPGERARTANRRAWIRTALRDAEAVVRPTVESASDDWCAEVEHVTRAFTSARLRREHEIARSSPVAHVESQGGLFDRRAERSVRANATAALERHRSETERITIIQASCSITRTPARLLLVLVP
jgi:hypothetical protein